MNKELKPVKARANGWNSCLYRLMAESNLLIHMTPTSKLRDKITAINIKIMELETFAKEQTEVL